MQSVSPVYRLRPGTSVLENDADLVLRAGAIHRHDITIDKQQSDAALIDALPMIRFDDADVPDGAP